MLSGAFQLVFSAGIVDEILSMQIHFPFSLWRLQTNVNWTIVFINLLYFMAGLEWHFGAFTHFFLYAIQIVSIYTNNSRLCNNIYIFTLPPRPNLSFKQFQKFNFLLILFESVWVLVVLVQRSPTTKIKMKKINTRTSHTDSKLEDAIPRKAYVGCCNTHDDWVDENILFVFSVQIVCVMHYNFILSSRIKIIFKCFKRRH